MARFEIVFSSKHPAMDLLGENLFAISSNGDLAIFTDNSIRKFQKN